MRHSRISIASFYILVMHRLSNKSCSASNSNSSSTKHLVNYDGKIIETTVTDKAAVANDWIQEILITYSKKPTVVCLDIEWRPNRFSNKSNKTATFQLCIANKCLILQLFYMNKIPVLLRKFLEHPNFTFVGVEVEGDIEKLRDDYQVECKKSADIRELAKMRWPGRFRRPGLKDLAREVCGLHMEKPRHVTLSNWEARVLSNGQVEYACIDAYASYKIGHKLLMEN